MKIKWLLSLVLYFPSFSLASNEIVMSEDSIELDSENESIYFGHLLTQTSQTLKKGQVALGNHAAVVGISDNINIGTAPWLIYFYNMPNVLIRGKYDLDGESSLGAQIVYFKTSEMFNDWYLMEALSGTFSWSRKVSPILNIHTSLGYLYYFEESFPFSFRLEPFNSDPFQINLTTLLDTRIYRNFHIGAEVGVVGANYVYPWIHTALSFRYQSSSMVIQLGYSLSSNLAQGGYSTSLSPRDREPLGVAFIPHPEVQLQYYF